jgi:hypothetical protein
MLRCIARVRVRVRVRFRVRVRVGVRVRVRVRVRMCVRVRVRVCGNSIISIKMARAFAGGAFCSIICPNNMNNMGLERYGLKQSS